MIQMFLSEEDYISIWTQNYVFIIIKRLLGCKRLQITDRISTGLWQKASINILPPYLTIRKMLLNLFMLPIYRS